MDKLIQISILIFFFWNHNITSIFFLNYSNKNIVYQKKSKDNKNIQNLKDFKTKIFPNPNNSPILPPSLPPPPSRSDPISRQKSQNQSLRLKKEILLYLLRN